MPAGQHPSIGPSHASTARFRIAQAERTVTCVIVPADVQDMDAVEEQPKATHTVHTGVGWWTPRVLPRPDRSRQARPTS